MKKLLLAVFALSVLSVGCASLAGKTRKAGTYYVPATITDFEYVEPRRPSGQTTVIYHLKMQSSSKNYTYRTTHGPNDPLLDKISRKVILKILVLDDGTSEVVEMEFRP